MSAEQLPEESISLDRAQNGEVYVVDREFSGENSHPFKVGHFIEVVSVDEKGMIVDRTGVTQVEHGENGKVFVRAGNTMRDWIDRETASEIMVHKYKIHPDDEALMHGIEQSRHASNDLLT